MPHRCNVPTHGDISRLCEDQQVIFSLQVDKSADIANLVNVRYLFKGTVQEDFLLFCCRLVTRTTGEEIFSLTDIFMRTIVIKWTRCTFPHALTGQKQ